MKVVILAGGLGTRISEESHLKPKPMIEIGELPILVHIMKIYASQGFSEFIICAGYKQRIIKEYFAHYFLYNNDVTFDMHSNERIIHNTSKDNWKVTVVDTGLNTQTGGRVKRIQKYVGNESFMLTYGDAVGNIDLNELLKSHKESGKLGTMTVYNFGQSKGVIDLNKDGSVNAFREKSDFDGNLINIGFMVLEPKIFDYIDGDSIPLEQYPLSELVRQKQLNAYIHKGFWQCMDTLREKEKLEELWNSGNAPWKVWED
ncbi:glucose-1-phosphate cytidylyltransferase [Pseudobutyrivibrio sp.]|uniref:glucose-1-phosphate cytidylyltransferase n=1 Tax=Pseudobutyrivibrio sp. TaxID=2014367 RepID=UPI001B7AA79F|nr:glucose-1-phosphate cytidylyltransferase [Pseudobutyrivibrio sp.]MBP3263700.1 glucose-1-phosphate cytidylyltransferase [Pseudobutyrivibrio sp.]